MLLPGTKLKHESGSWFDFDLFVFLTEIWNQSFLGDDASFE